MKMCEPAFYAISFGRIAEVNEGNFLMLYILIGVIPFNLLLSLIVVGITAPVHKRLKVLYDMIGTKASSNIDLDKNIEEIATDNKL